MENGDTTPFSQKMHTHSTEFSTGRAGKVGDYVCCKIGEKAENGDFLRPETGCMFVKMTGNFVVLRTTVGGAGVEGKVGKIACHRLVIRLRADHGGVVAAEREVGEVDGNAPLFAEFLHRFS